MVKLQGRATLLVALFCLLMAPLGCRDEEEPPLTPHPIQFTMNFSPGDSYLYDAWLIDEFGYIDLSTQTYARQRVLSTNGSLDGFANVITLIDSTTMLRDTAAAVQVFRIAQAANGDLYRYGLLADIARATGFPAPPQQWDRIAAFSLGFGQSWTVGFQDSTLQQTVVGEFSGVGETFTVKVNGVQYVFPAYRVDLYGAGVQYSFWVSSSPPAFLRYILEPGDTWPGAQFELIDASVIPAQ